VIGLLLVLFGVVGTGLIAGGRRLGTAAFGVAALPFVIGAAGLAVALPDALDTSPTVQTIRWVPALDLAISFRLDGFGATLGLIACAIGAVVLWYSIGYFGEHARDPHRLAGIVTIFGGAMVGLVLSDDLFGMFLFWELTSITSYLLIGFDDERAAARGSALQALITTGGGGLCLLAACVLIRLSTGTSSISELVNRGGSGAMFSTGLALAFVGAATKSAQAPFSFWLPGAMVASTPISAYLHSATMVKAGVVLVARLAPVGATTTWWAPVVCSVGLITMLTGGWRAVRQVDLKLLAAYGTVSQLGLMMALFGAGEVGLTGAGIAVLVAHAVFKSAIFMSVGVIDHQHGTRDLRRLPRPGPGWGPALTVLALSAASMAGLPPLLGFVAKEQALVGLTESSWELASAMLIVVCLGSVLTLAYSARLVWGALGRGQLNPEATAALPVAAPKLGFVAPGTVPTLVTVLGIGALGPLSHLADRSAEQLTGSATKLKLHLWDGWTVPLALSAAIITAGVLVFVAVGRRTGAERHILASGASVFTGMVRRLNVVAARTTGVVQNGSLPIYIGVILLFVMIMPMAVGLSAGRPSGDLPPFGDHPMELVIVPVILTAAIGAVVARRRFAAAICLGGVGYGMMAAFLLAGAPDLALTQAAVETLTTVLFVLVLRALPEDFDQQSQSRIPGLQVFRVVVSLVVAATVFVSLLAATADRTAPPISSGYLARSLKEAGGRNVVNVILVDFRGYDTLGEITVLAIAALGAVSLATFGRGQVARNRPRIAPAHRSLLLDTVARVAFPALLVLGIYFLFAGHNQPGGGFVGGLVAGIGLGLRYASGGWEELRRAARWSPWTVLGTGLMIAATAAVVPLMLGGDILESAKVSVDLGPLGTPGFSTATFFDSGVFVVVVGLVLMVFEAFGLPTGSDSEDRSRTGVTTR